MIPIIDINRHIHDLQKPWSPVEVARVNNSVVRLALFHGEYHWHSHTNEDELFYVVSGAITIKLKGHEDITLSSGQMAVVPKGVEHCPISSEKSYVLLFEPHVLKSVGD